MKLTEYLDKHGTKQKSIYDLEGTNVNCALTLHTCDEKSHELIVGKDDSLLLINCKSLKSPSWDAVRYVVRGGILIKVPLRKKDFKDIEDQRKDIWNG